MRIAVIAHAHHAIRQPFVGGLETHTHQMIMELMRQGHNVTLFAKAGSTIGSTIVPIFNGNAWNGKNPMYDLGYRRAMRMIANDTYDLIINNSLNYLPLRLHGVNMPPMITIFHTPPFSKLAKVLAKSAASNRTYIAVSAFTAAQWQQYCSEPIQVVPNGLDLTAWKANLRRPATVKAAWVGRITPEKGTHTAIEACIQAGMPLTISGHIYDKTYFNTRIRPLLENPLITFAGHLDHISVNALLANASVALVTPLWDEPFGLVAIEAWASGTPVAALPNGALPSLVYEPVGSLATSDSVADLVVAMQHALRADRAQCRAYAEDNFSLANMVASYLKLIPQSVGESTADLAWQPTP